MPEDECLFPGVAGVEFVAYAGELCGMSRTSALQRAHEVLNHVGLGEARYRPVESYSAGMKQRLKLAAALVHDPRLLILDEPTNGMDPAGRQEMLELARDLAHGKEMSLLFSSHLLPDVEFVCDHVLVLARGPAGGAGADSGTEGPARPMLRSPREDRREGFRPPSWRSRLHREVSGPQPSGAPAAGQVGTDAVGARRRRGRADPPPAAAEKHARGSVLEGHRTGQ